MITFRHRRTGRVLGVNHKAMFSFVACSDAFDRAKLGWCDYLLWRDPLERIVSLFHDKCRQSLDPDRIQDVQRLLATALRLASVAELAGVSFEDFVVRLAPILTRDRHLWPQFHKVDLDHVGEVVDIETGLPQLGRVLRVDFARLENATSHRPALEYYSAHTRATVERLYADDYRHRRHRSLPFKTKRVLGLIT